MQASETTDRAGTGTRPLDVPAAAKPLQALGRATLGTLDELGRTFLIGGLGLANLFRLPSRLGLLVEQLDKMAVGGLPIILLTGGFTGAVFTYETAWAAGLFGAQGMVSGSVGVALTRGLAPTITALLLAGRSGSAIAAELASMRISEQIDAMVAMAVDPINYLVKPRIWAALLAVPMLTLVFDLVGIIGSWVVSIFVLGLSRPEFFVRLQDWVDWNDVTAGLIKATVFGLIIGTVGCARGMYAEGGAEGVGQATTSSVVISSVAIIVVNFFLAVLMPQ